MGADVSTVGGGPATPLGEEWVNVLRYLIAGGETGGAAPGFGPSGSSMKAKNSAGGSGGVSPVNQTSAIMQGLNRILTGSDWAGTGKALEEIIQTDTARGAADLRSRFGASGGTSAGTPAAVSEAIYRADAAPRGALALGQLQAQQLSQLFPIFQLIAQMAGLGIPQASTLVQPNPFVTGIDTLANAGKSAASIAEAF